MDFFKKNIPGTKTPSWIIDTDKINYLLNKFIKEFGKHILSIYQKDKSMDMVLKFLEGSYFGKPQIQVEWGEIGDDAKKRIIIIFKPLVDFIGVETFSQIITSYSASFLNLKANELTKSQKLIKFFSFLLDNDVFGVK